MNKVHYNIFANYIGRIWGFFSVFIFVPFYIEYLGDEAYGMVSFYTVILGFLSFADAGLTSTLNREIARADKNLFYKSDLLRTIETLYIFICLIIILTLWVSAPTLVNQWLNIEGIQKSDAIRYVRLIGINVAIQFFCTLYISGLMGLQKQVLSNLLQILWGLFRSGILLIPLFYYPSLDVFFGWQIAITILYLILSRHFLNKELVSINKPKFSLAIIASVWRYTLGMLLMAITSSILIQTDKIVTSKFLTLTEFGYYSLASTISQIPLMIVTPIGLAILPKITEIITNKNKEKLLLLFHKSTFVITAFSTLITFTLIAYMPNMLLLWTHNEEMVKSTTLVARILCLGSLFQSLQLISYYLGIANGHTKTTVKMGVISLLFLVPTMIFLVSRFGIIGAGIPWFAMSFTTFIALNYLMIRKFTSIQFFEWFLQDLLKPFFVILSFTLVVYVLTKDLSNLSYSIWNCLITAIIGLIIIVFLYFNRFPEDNFNKKIKIFTVLKK